MAGSVIKKPNNKWELRVSLGYDENNKQRRKTKTVYAKTKKEAEKMLAEFFLELKDTLVIDHDITFKEFYSYLRTRHFKKLGIITINRYEQLLNNRILPAFGDKKLSKITGDDIITFLNSLQNEGMRLDNKQKRTLSNTSIAHHYKLLALIFNKAYEWKYLYKNPCKEIPKDQIVRPAYIHYPIWKQKELTRFLTILEEQEETFSFIKNKLMFYISLITGARKGEFMGLTWDCVDLDNKSLNINKSLKFICGKAVGFGKPKTESSIRILYFDDYLKALFIKYRSMLEKHLYENGVVNTNEYVFISREFTATKETLPVDGKGFYLWLKRMCDRYNMPHIAVHSIRAMAATYALTNGMPLNMVQAMLGHSNIATTSIYQRDVSDSRKDFTNIHAQKISAMRNDN